MPRTAKLSVEEKKERQRTSKKAYAKRTGYAAQKANDREYYKLPLRLHRVNDAEMIDFLGEVESKQKFLKELLRNEIKNKKV